jgi:phthiodiolone/phenolphthiodiolone dimycocerosates ketoreductase
LTQLKERALPFTFGIADPCIHSRVTPDAMLKSTKALALAVGADSLWVPDHLPSCFPRSLVTREHVGISRLVPDLDACYEPWTVLGHLAARNRVGRLRLGVGSTDPTRRNPAVTAQAAATLHQLSRGRAILGIGTGEGMDNTPYGVHWDRPVSRFEEGVATIRALWDSKGEPVSRDSPFYPLRDAVMGVPPYRGTRPELWIGAHGPRMRRIAGRYADVWFPALTMDPTEYGEHLTDVRKAAADAGRDPQTIRGAKYFFVVTGHSAGVVDEILEAPVVKSYALCAPSSYWARHGAEHPLGADFPGVQALIPQTIDEATALDYVRRTPTSLIRNFVLAGTPSEILDQLAEWRDQGLSYALLLNLGVLTPNMATGLLTTLPYIRMLREVKKLGPARSAQPNLNRSRSSERGDTSPRARSSTT